VVQHDPVPGCLEVALQDVYGPLPLPGAHIQLAEHLGQVPLNRRLLGGCNVGEHAVDVRR
jgi:hypothetical protein